MKKDDLVELGRCTSAHGIKGGFSFKLFNDQESVLKDGLTITLFPFSENSSLDSLGQNFKITSIKFGNKTMAYLEGINNRNVVEEMVPFTIFYPRDLFPEISDDEIYLGDLVGLDVIHYETGENLGKIKNFYDNGAQPVLVVKGKMNEELPFVEEFFPEFDLEEKTIKLIPPSYIER